MQPLQPGPFNGAFDQIDHQHPAFVPIVVVTLLLGAVFVATVWALWRRHPRKPLVTGRGFDLVPPDDIERTQARP